MIRLVIAVTLLAAATPVAAETFVISGGTVALGDGSEPIPNGQVVIRDGKVVAAGDIRMKLPDGTRVIDATGKWVTPGIVAGLPERAGTFAGGPFTFLHHGYAVLTGLTAVALYVVAGCAWLYWKTDGDLQVRAARIGSVMVVVLAIGTAASWLLATSAGSVVLHPGEGSRVPVWIAGAVVLAAGLGVALRAFAAKVRTDWLPAAAILTVYAGGLLLAGGLLYPTLVPPSVTVHAAASPHSSLLFVLIGVGIFVPIILVYQTYAYIVFRGKVGPAKEATAP